jgi:hypothetical protein
MAEPELNPNPEDFKYFVERYDGFTILYRVIQMPLPGIAQGITKESRKWVDSGPAWHFPHSADGENFSFEQAKALADEWGISLDYEA